ncbi:hypothetical protein PoB_002799300 [Plakobranchus ocellatus]|uniref:Prostatic spermine-binding protein-like n=1 Tax=Plakobranchus ocellatus TaxID=259542 RepID=A0AAV4A482_9GAST|nr:hypothetical protein PoB_002799300 [Plakobranchus ocellatus]
MKVRAKNCENESSIESDDDNHFYDNCNDNSINKDYDEGGDGEDDDHEGSDGEDYGSGGNDKGGVGDVAADKNGDNDVACNDDEYDDYGVESGIDIDAYTCVLMF